VAFDVHSAAGAIVPIDIAASGLERAAFLHRPSRSYSALQTAAD